jgi:hypothetical protein
MVQNQEEGNHRYPPTTMKRFVNIPRKLSMDNFKFHLYQNQTRKWKGIE